LQHFVKRNYIMSESQARAQVSSIVAMVAALNVDYERLEELCEQAMMPRYVVGRNMPGYLPDATPDEFDDADDARAALAQSMRDDADNLYDGIDPECLSTDASHVPSLILQLREAADALGLLTSEGNSADYGQTIGATHYWLTCSGHMGLNADDATEYDELTEAAGECESTDDAERAIDEDPLSVECRSAWQTPGEELTPDEYRIVLCTGGPHVELQCESDGSRVRVIWRDWGTSGEYFPDSDEREALETYCARFVGGY
jgi:hypothetical protein